MRLSKREIFLLYVLVIALVVFVSVTFILKPMIKKHSEISLQYQTKLTEYRDKNYESSEIKKLQGKIEEQENKLEENKNKLIGYKNDTQLFKFVCEYFASKNFVIDSYVTSGESEVVIDKNKISDIVVVAVSLNAKKTGESETQIDKDIKELVTDMQAYFNSVILNSFSYNIAMDSEVQGNIKLNFNIYMSNKK